MKEGGKEGGKKKRTTKRPNESGKQEESERVDDSKKHASKRLNGCVRKEAIMRESESMGLK